MDRFFVTDMQMAGGGTLLLVRVNGSQRQIAFTLTAIDGTEQLQCLFGDHCG